MESRLRRHSDLPRRRDRFLLAGGPPRGPERLTTFRGFGDRDLRALLELNERRGSGPSPELQRLEAFFGSRFGADRRLAVYGSLAPGEPNHGQLAPLAGEWVSGLAVRGHLLAAGWADGLGYPALRWSPAGPSVPVELLVSADLPRHWDRLDRFEGSDYLRILVPLFKAGRVVEVANLYAAFPGG